MPKRPEISTDDFAKALEDEPLAVIPFEPQIFGTAANNGQMIAELSSSHKTAEMFRAARADPHRPRRNEKIEPSLLSPLIDKLLKRQA